MSHNPNPVLNGLPRTMYRIKKAAAASYGCDRPLLTFIYLGFDCGLPDDGGGWAVGRLGGR